MNNLESLLKELGCKTPADEIASDRRDTILDFLKMEIDYRRQYKIKRLLSLSGIRHVKTLPGGDYGFAWNPVGRNARDLEHFVKLLDFTPMEAIVAATRDNALAVGLEGQVGEVAPGKLADVIVLDQDPLADITVLQGGRHLTWVIKDGRIVDLDPREDMLTFEQAAE